MKKSDSPSRSGRFDLPPDQAVVTFSQSVSFDWRLWRQDILGSIAHATMLKKIGLLTAEEQMAIIEGLDQIGKEIEDGKFEWKEGLEDVHMNIEAELTRRVPAGAKLHAGRSRNDQVALDLRMWLRDEIFGLVGEIRTLQKGLLDLADRNSRVMIPGYTHLQRAQPVFFAHHLLAYIEMFRRDEARFIECSHRVNVCPLGSGALGGSTLPLDRKLVARLLGFVDDQDNVRLTENSMDAVGDRDFAIEFAADAALVAMHLSRLAEDLIIWSTKEFQFIRIGDAFTTGSSLMPQKKNPDVAELIRGKTARVYGNLTALLVLLKALPMTYNRDLQEDKERLFDTMDTVRATVRMMAAMTGHITVNKAICAEAVSDPTLLATDLADYLVTKGVPFRKAHHLVGKLVALSEEKKKPLNQLSPAEFKSVDRMLGAGALKVFNLAHAVNKRNFPGAPGKEEVKKQLKRWRKLLSP